MTVKLADRIAIDPEVCFGKPVIASTRIPVHMALELLSDGLTPQEIIERCYSHLTEENILACISCANSLVKNEEICIA